MIKFTEYAKGFDSALEAAQAAVEDGDILMAHGAKGPPGARGGRGCPGASRRW